MSTTLKPSDPRGVAASRSQSGGTALQGQHGARKNRSRTGEKGSDPEGEKPVKTAQKVQLAVGREPTFYIGGGNGVALVEGPLTELGWKRITDKQNENFKMKWVECKNTINYNAFKEGDQLVNHIPNCNLLTNKMGLLTTLQCYERLNSSVKRRETRIKLADFIPETFRLEDPKERELFLESFRDNDIWICKPTGMNQGKGIYLVRDLEEFKETLKGMDERRNNTRTVHRANMGRIIQRYITHPLLLENRKFDIRAYMLIGSTSPYLVLYHKGYVRLSLVDYDVKVDDLTAHLTNQYIQKKDPNYKEGKESTAWSMDKFNDYINEHVAPEKGLEQDWVYNTLTTKMKQIIGYCFHAVKNRLHCKIGYFDLYGLDFMVDEDMKVYLIEVNVNPSLATNCEALKEVIPGVVRETLYLTLECYEKSRRGQALMPLHSLKNFDVLYNGCTKSRDRASTAAAGPTRASVLSPARRQKTPGKDTHSQGHIRSSLRGSLADSKNKTRLGMTPKATLQPLSMNPAASPSGRGGVTLPPLVMDGDKITISNSSTAETPKISEPPQANHKSQGEGITISSVNEESEVKPTKDNSEELRTTEEGTQQDKTETESGDLKVGSKKLKTDPSFPISVKVKTLVAKSQTPQRGKRRGRSPDRGN